MTRFVRQRCSLAYGSVKPLQICLVRHLRCPDWLVTAAVRSIPRPEALQQVHPVVLKTRTQTVVVAVAY